MGKAYTTLRSDILSLLQDSSNAVFTTAELDILIPNALIYLSEHAYPWEKKLTKTTTASSRDLTLSTGDKWRLLGIDKLEYLVDKDPRRFRNYSKFGDVVTIKCNATPNGESIYFFFNKIHLLSTAIGTSDTAGAVKTAGAVGDVTLALKSLGTGTIDEQTALAITGDSTTYYVTTQATIAVNEATVSIWPPLTAICLADAVVTLSLSTTLDTKLEDWLERYVAAKAAISKATLSYAQVDTAIDTIALAVTAIGLVAARVTQAIADIASGRTEAAKISTILDTANTEIDKIAARLTQATTDIAAGRTEADKVPAIVTTAATAIGLVAARIAQAVTDIASARTAIALGVTAISAANTEMGLTDAQVDLAVTALASGNSLLNTVPVGGGAGEYMGQAASDVGTAQGYMLSGQGLLQKSSADFNNATADFGAAAREVDAGMAKVREAQASLEQANTDMAANRTYIDQAIAQMRLAQGYFQEGQGYVMEANTRMTNNASYLQTANGELNAGRVKAEEATANMRLVATRLQVSQGGLRYEAWGRQELAKVEQELSALNGYSRSRSYPMD